MDGYLVNVKALLFYTLLYTEVCATHIEKQIHKYLSFQIQKEHIKTGKGSQMIEFLKHTAY